MSFLETTSSLSIQGGKNSQNFMVKTPPLIEVVRKLKQSLNPQKRLQKPKKIIPLFFIVRSSEVPREILGTGH